MSDSLFVLENVRKRYQGPTEEVEVLSGVNCRIETGESLAIVGASGSGKTTLLHILGTLDTPSEGTVLFDGGDLSDLSEAGRMDVRNRHLGFVFQQHHLLPEFTALENVAMPGLIAGLPRGEAMDRASEALDLVGLTERGGFEVTRLSGGERQRAALARGILMRPRALLADEPTGSLDEKTGRRIAEVMLKLNSELNMTLIVVTHNLELARGMGRQLELHEGVLHASLPC
ncbi:ABC transporter ATP-binding protein [Desulfohalovibrio reitneri]|uniref:ABC transporter ATP-binding protein n=1 Tax=Desulfohalovibrio reitneri TaxID=1307759 RepID=UPI0004A72A1B|nr:ABC transporter ATP-binding protein [Desulfohalovibrio reitneri]